MFDTFGPFELENQDEVSLRRLFQSIREYDPPGLLQGVGVYVAFTKDESGETMPWYVGRTRNSFHQRMSVHVRQRRFEKQLAGGPVYFLLLARANQGIPIGANEAIKGRGLKAIHYLELVLIGTCLKLNHNLINIQDAAFHRLLHVPGYIDNTLSDRNFPAAQTLSKLLKS